jgi:hypothetical protein
MPIIQFLDHRTGCDWITRYHMSYIQGVVSNPRNAATRSYTDMKTYCEHVMDWSLAQKEHIRQLINFLYARVPSEWKWLVEYEKWQFVLVKNDMESGMPHTIHSAIVFSVAWIKSSTISVHSAETLLHERIHVLQKLRPARFHDLYTRWRWHTVQCSESIPDVIHDVHRHNPDTPSHWIKFDQTERHVYWIPCVRLRGQSLRTVDYFLVKVHTQLRVMEWHPLSSVSWYTDFYGVNNHCYHPAENSAVIISDMCFNTKRITTPASEIIVQWNNTTSAIYS